MDKKFKHEQNSNSEFVAYSLKKSEDHIEFIDEVCERDERECSLSRVPPCFVLNDKSLIEKINHSQQKEGGREVIFSTSKARKGSYLDTDLTSDNVFLEEMWDDDLSDIEDGDAGGSYFNQLDLSNLNNLSFIRPPSLEKSYSMPPQRVSTPRKRKYSSARFEVERRLCEMLQEDRVEDGDIEENYLDTVWCCGSQSLYPQCGMVFNGKEDLSSPICPHDNYQLIEELPTISAKRLFVPPTLTSKAEVNQAPSNYSTDFFNIDLYKQQEAEERAVQDCYNTTPLIGIDLDFNNNRVDLHTTPIQVFPQFTQAINASPFLFDGRETYRDKLLEGIEQAQARSQNLARKTQRSAPDVPIQHDWRSVQGNEASNHQPTFRTVTDVGSSVDCGKNEGDEFERKAIANGRMAESEVGLEGGESDGEKVKLIRNGMIISDAGMKNKRQVKNNQELKTKKVKAREEGIFKKEKSRCSNEQTPPTKEQTPPTKEQTPPTKEQTPPKKAQASNERWTSKKESLPMDLPAKASGKQSKQSPDTNLPSHTKYLDKQNIQFTNLKVKVKSSMNDARNDTDEKSNYLSLSSDDEGIFTSPMLSPSENNHHLSTRQLTPQHRSKKQRKQKKIKGEAYSHDGDSVDGFKNRHLKHKDWKRPSNNFDEILWRPALSMGIIIITGIFIFYFRDKIPLMLSSEFYYHKSSI